MTLRRYYDPPDLSKQPKGSKVFTPLGAGRVVYELPDGTLVVQFDHGSGHIFRPEELFQPGDVIRPRRVRTVRNVNGVTEDGYEQVQSRSLSRELF